MSKHTQGPLHNCASGDCGCGQILDQESSFIATCPNPENLRRLVACWNACQGIATEDLDKLRLEHSVAALNTLADDIEDCEETSDLISSRAIRDYANNLRDDFERGI